MNDTHPSIVLYQSAVKSIAFVGSMLQMHDLPGLLNDISRAGTTGPILDPTLYRDKVKAMEEDRELIEAALPLWRLTQKRMAAMRREVPA